MSEEAVVATEERKLLVVESRIKELVQSYEGIRYSGGLSEFVSEAVYKLIDEAVKRCKENGRATVRGCDL